MATPTVIHQTTGNIALLSSGGDTWAPIFYGSSIYALTLLYDINLNDSTLSYFKSTDGGLTWTEQDAAHAPSTFATNADPIKVGSKIGIVYSVSGGTGQVVHWFNMATDLWETVGAQSSEVGGPIFWEPLSNGHVVIVYQRQSGGPYSVHLDEYNGVTWSGPITVASSPTNTILPLNVAVDSADRVYIAMYFNTFPPRDIKMYVYAAGVLGAPTTIGSYNNPSTVYGPGIYLPIADEIRFPVLLRGEAISGFSSPGYWVGTPSSAPIWTLINLAIEVPDPSNSPTINFAYDDEAKIFLVWQSEIDSHTGEEEVNYSYQNNLGSWSAVATLWNSLNDPLTPPSPFPGDVAFLGGAWVTSSGTLGVVLGLDQDFPIIGNWCGTLYYVSVVLTVPLALPCPLPNNPGTVGVAFTETLIASGGSPPYTYAVVMGYSLPDGLTLDPATGIISGIPTTAGVVFTAYMVTDSLGNTATTIGTCPITINPPTPPPPSGSGPCVNATTDTSLDSYLELRKVLVAWKKETHLPIRGKS